MHNLSTCRGKNMEQDYIAGLYQSLGMSAGAKFSAEDVSLLYSKMFNFPSSATEAHTAMKKIAGGDSSWTCIGENVLDVLLEMEREREKKEMLYWDLLLLNTGNPNTFHHTMDSLLQNIDLNAPKKAYTSESVTLLQMERWVPGKELSGEKTSMKRLKKAARQCWASLASEGVRSILPSKWQGHNQKIRGQAWGCVSLSDVLLLVDVKYDAVTQLLYTEMLQEDHTKGIWETMLPWRQHQEVEKLGDRVEEALASVDMLSLAELPGVFRIYNKSRACLGASFRSFPDCVEQSWSAVSLLNMIHTFRQQEQDALTVLGERLHGESLKLLCLCIRLATVRAQREKMSYSALLAAQQSWETWPHVSSPCREEQASLWLHSEPEENEDDFETVEQQSVLQLLVLMQEQERKHLVTIIHGISIEDLQASVCTVPTKDDNHLEDALRNGCIKRLHQIHIWLQTYNGTENPLKQTYPKPQPESQSQEKAHGEWSQFLLESCALLLLTRLMELQEVQASALLQAMMDENAQLLQSLRDKYESEIQAQCFTNLLHLLISDAPLAAVSMLNLYPNCIENSSSEQIRVQSSYTGQVEVQNISGRSAEAEPVTSNKRRNSTVNEVQTAGGTYKQDVCSGCGAVMEDLPYLEILCVSDAHEGLAAEGEVQEQGQGSKLKSPQNCEKQGSLITLAWSKPPESDTDNAADAADGSAEQIEHGASSLKTQAHPTQSDVLVQERDGEDLKPSVLRSASPDHCDTQSVNEQCNTVEQLTSSSSPAADQPNKGEAAFECKLQTCAFIAESQVTQPDPLTDSSETIPHTDVLCSGSCSDIKNAGRDVMEVETEPKQWNLTGSEPAYYEDQKYSPEATVDCSLSECKAKKEPAPMEREQVREPVSAIEREKTMRNLVDMQRKVEQRQQRDRERQLLRVQERLSIIQNRKAEEDLLGLKHTDRIKQLTQDLPPEDRNQQKTVVKERLEQLRRERSYVMQSKRDRNTTGFKELLGPVALQSRETEDGDD